METEIKKSSEHELNQIENLQTLELENKKYECSVCGMDEWCGTDGCPMDPQ